ncbi:FecCD family ABC transporter permease [Donghicola mangrovi]|uniref:Iron ABC transporter permease n=1 Tax=Donghicola mangrovi TaxID=2729614 RepID=A0A850Q5L5_9RHOB|nr:iron ABC transporter permease [Donghicola mangrovi]NVO25007.1 iron ABC transporter permease [Donghicola mangrovi]
MVAYADSIAPRRAIALRVRGWLWVALIASCILSLTTGATGVTLWDALVALLTPAELPLSSKVVLWDIRLPRMLMAMVVGASLAVSGAVMQGLFRNPLADPGIVGVSAGAGTGAVVAIVLGGAMPFAALGPWLVPVAAAAGAWATIMVLYLIATRRGVTAIATLLLAGIAIAALAGALSGVLIYAADDTQLRDLTFWGLGSLAGATWTKLLAAGPLMLAGLACARPLARGLNGLALGEAAAHHIGLPVQRLKRLAILSTAAATGAAVAVSGGIGFVGIVVPHLLRLISGPDHEELLPNAALMGASLLLLADLISRVIVAPAELPIGIVTATLGGPFFLWLLLRGRTFGGL